MPIGFFLGGASIQKVDLVRVNERIRVPQVRLIDEEGQQIGIIDTDQAIDMAMDRGLDLVEVAPQAKPPVCRIMDYGKFKYELAKKAKISKKRQHQVHIKEVQFRPNIEKHDYEFKKSNIIKFLEHDNKVRVQVIFRGREIMHKELGEELANKLIADLQENAQVESKPHMEGKMLSFTFIPLKAKDKKKTAE